MFPSFSYNIIAIYFSSLYQNNFFVGKAILILLQMTVKIKLGLGIFFICTPNT